MINLRYFAIYAHISSAMLDFGLVVFLIADFTYIAPSIRRKA